MKMTLTTQSQATGGFEFCLCGCTKRINKPCQFCGRGDKQLRTLSHDQRIAENNQLAKRRINSYRLVLDTSLSPVPKGDHYMERIPK